MGLEAINLDPEPQERVVGGHLEALFPAVRPVRAPEIAVTVDINEVAEFWLELEKSGLQSPAQSHTFVADWVQSQAIPVDDQIYATASLQGQPLALLALEKSSRWGASLYRPFAPAHSGSCAPLVNEDLMRTLPPQARYAMWERMLNLLPKTDIVLHPCIVEPGEDGAELYAGLGERILAETLYRVQFESWEECDRQQRTRSRRKHDKQQGARLEAMGEVTFEELGPGDDVAEPLRTLFDHKAVRFAEQGISNPFAGRSVQDFYKGLFAEGRDLSARMHVLRLNGRIVSVRYHLVHQDRLFTLITSMSPDPAVQNGSPGKQNMLRVMQTIFNDGVAYCDMGAGFSDEKRHWCNIRLPLYHHYHARTPYGRACAASWRTIHRLKARLKSSPAAYGLYKQWRARFGAQSDS